jgi:succinate dehydrogenase / fumarate reductase, cytochrome b subunit
MIVLKQILTTTFDISRNRNEGTLAFILHRLTGLALAGYIFLHLIVLGSEFIFGKGSFNALMNAFVWPLIKIAEIGLITIISFHLINGIRIVVIDLFRIVKEQKLFFWIVMVLCLIIFLITAAIFMPKIVG